MASRSPWDRFTGDSTTPRNQRNDQRQLDRPAGPARVLPALPEKDGHEGPQGLRFRSFRILELALYHSLCNYLSPSLPMIFSDESRFFVVGLMLARKIAAITLTLCKRGKRFEDCT
jgi:hypothetical protein